jgi:hypothetical protein
MELPHILVLIDDPKHTVIEPLTPTKPNLKSCMIFDLMLGSGHLAGYAVNAEAHENQVVEALRGLAKPRNLRGQIRHRQLISPFCSSRWAMAITPLQLPKPFGKR